MVTKYDKVKEYIRLMGLAVIYEDRRHCILKVENEADGIQNLIIGVAQPILIMEQYLFSFKRDNTLMFKKLLQKSRDMVHGAFVVNEEGDKVLFRYTMQLENLDYNEFESAVNSLSLMLGEYYQEIIDFSKN